MKAPIVLRIDVGTGERGAPTLTNTRAERPTTTDEEATLAARGRGYQTRPFLKIRRAYTDLLTATKRKNIIHGLVEIDVTNAHRLLRQREAAGEDLSFTAFLIHAVARAVDEDRIMHAYRRRGRLILFDDVDVNTQIETAVVDGAPAARFAGRLAELIEQADGLSADGE